MKIKVLIIFIFLSLNQFVSSQTKSYKTYFSDKYGYSIEYQTSFSPMEIIGRNVDFKVVDNKGNNIVIVIKKLPLQEENATVDFLLEIPVITFEENFQLPNVKLIKRGFVYVDNERGVFLHYSSKDINKSYTAYFISYNFIYKRYNYSMTATCDILDLAHMQPVFFRALQSFTFPK